MKLEHVTDSTWAVVDGSTYGNVGCINSTDHLVVIDTGIAPPIAKEFRELIHRNVGEPITEVILTHYHSDHVFGVQEFKDCRVIATSVMAAMYPELLKDRWSSEGLKEMINYYSQNDPVLGRKLENLQILPPTLTFDTSMTLGKKEEIVIQHTGGHTAGHAIVLFNSERVLFAGDLIFCKQYPYAGDPTNNPVDWMNALKTILEMPVDYIVPGHGPLCGKEEIRKHLAYFKALEKWIHNQLQQEIPLEKVLEVGSTSPAPPYDLKVDTRLEFTLKRWYQFYSNGRT